MICNLKQKKLTFICFDLGSDSDDLSYQVENSDEEKDEDTSTVAAKWENNILSKMSNEEYLKTLTEKDLFHHGQRIHVLFDLEGNDHPNPKGKMSPSFRMDVVEGMKKHFTRIPRIETIWIDRLPASRSENLGYEITDMNTDIIFNWCKRLGLMVKSSKKRNVRKNMNTSVSKLHTYLTTLLEAEGVIKVKSPDMLMNQKGASTILSYTDTETNNEDTNLVRFCILLFVINLEVNLI